jgi:hypothetical protein
MVNDQLSILLVPKLSFDTHITKEGLKLSTIDPLSLEATADRLRLLAQKRLLSEQG